MHPVVARERFRSQNRQNTRCSRRFWTFKLRFAWQAQGMRQAGKYVAGAGVREGFKNVGRRGGFEEQRNF